MDQSFEFKDLSIIAKIYLVVNATFLGFFGALYNPKFVEDHQKMKQSINSVDIKFNQFLLIGNLLLASTIAYITYYIFIIVKAILGPIFN